VKIKTAMQVSLANLSILVLTLALMDISFAQSNSNIDNTLPNNISISSGPNALQGTSDDGVFKVMVDWNRNNINKENTFDLTFLESKSGVHIENVLYDIMLFKDDKHITESHRSSQTAKQQKFVFTDQGSYTLRIENINKTGAGINIPIQVVN
jgi:hypothetical protein